MANVTPLDILTSPIAVMLIGFAIFQTAVTILVHPVRKRMVLCAESFLAEERWSDEQKNEINQILDASMAFRVGFIMWLALLSLLLDVIMRRHVEPTAWQQELSDDPRFDSLMRDFAWSSAAANPLASIVTAILMAVTFTVSAVVHRLPKRQILEEVIEEPVLRTLQSCFPRPAAC